MLFCNYCHSEIEEYIRCDFQRERQIKRYECVVCGPLHYQTMLPLNEEASI